MTEAKKATIKNVHEAIVHVMNQVGYVQKQDADGLPYTFAGEAAFIKAIRPHMLEVDLFVVQKNVEEIIINSYTTAKGSIVHSRIFKFTWEWVHAPSGSTIVTTSIGEGADYGDKACNKSMTVGMKYNMRQTLTIETGDDPDETSSDVFEQSEKLDGVVWTEEHLEAIQKANPEADDAQVIVALSVFSEVAGWTPETPANDFKLLAEKYQKQKAIAEQDGESPGFRILVGLAFQEYNSEID